MLQTNFVGRGKRLDAIDIPRIGSIIRVGEDEVRAFMDVEASGSGFDRHGRPAMLFEPHVFYRNLSGIERDRAVAAGLAYPKWGQEGYPKDSYARLFAAIEINETAALRASSWGLGQILGENHAMAGYATPQDMVLAFMDDEEAHLEAMIRYLIAAGIDDDLREHRWKDVARGYNGPQYHVHGYDKRLEAAYRKWAGIPDTPWEGAPVVEPVAPSRYPTVRSGDTGFVVEHLQRTLKDLNYHTGKIDGVFGKATRASLLAFQADHRLVTDGVAGPKTWDILENDPVPRPISAERASATVNDLRKDGSSTIRNGDRGQIVLGTLTGTGALATVGDALDQAEQASGLLGRATGVLGQFSDLISANLPVLLVIGGAAAIYYITKMKKARVLDHKSGANMSR